MRCCDECKEVSSLTDMDQDSRILPGFSNRSTAIVRSDFEKSRMVRQKQSWTNSFCAHVVLHCPLCSHRLQSAEEQITQGKEVPVLSCVGLM